MLLKLADCNYSSLTVCLLFYVLFDVLLAMDFVRRDILPAAHMTIPVLGNNDLMIHFVIHYCSIFCTLQQETQIITCDASFYGSLISE